MKAILQLTPEIVDVVSKVYDAPIEGAVAVGTKTNNPFGMTTANGVSASSIFGKPTATTTTNNVFGGGGGGGGNSMFGPTTNVFVAQQPAVAPPFGQPTSIFSSQQTKPTNSIFGGGAQQTTFGQVPQNPVAVTGGGIFAQALKPQPTVAPTGMYISMLIN